ncbi:MAG: biotin--[acetyl-CoA-carboxylase] ligase [Bacteroidales bacterium]|nr:biotin--[acetyl-CoA-carboxylase] ligase [Candidatus Liminaster caballi]
MTKIHLDEIQSTNTWLLEALADGQPLVDRTVVWTKRQTAGRGQVGNTWEAEPDKNISFSVLLRPSFLHPREQFVISELTALSVCETVALMTPKPVKIKWPNDIYVGDDKLAGILIENSLQGMTICHSVIGVGINVNQERWVGNAPNPTSLKLVLGEELDPEEVLDMVTQRIGMYYRMLEQDKEKATAEIHNWFCQRLYRSNGFHPYVDAQTGESFEARLQGVDHTGHLHLLPADGGERAYGFKEVRFVLPCGVTKE